MKFTKTALEVLERRYLARDEMGELCEDVDGMFRRVAQAVAQAEAGYGGDVDRWAEEFYGLMVSGDFLPNSPTLMNAGRPLGQLSACFVLPVDDSIDGIFDTVKAAAIVHQTGGGTGFSFSRLRPRGDLVSTTRGQASGPVSFMSVFDAATHAINQGGFRRGANMGLLRVDHPDIEEFVQCKNDTSKFTNFNISVGVTDEFMKAVEKGAEFPLVNPRDGRVVRRVRARDLWDLIVESAWATGEPGLVFLDEINRKLTVSCLGKIEATNPCGEQPLLPYESCNLGSINLANMLKDGELDDEKLCKTVQLAVRFLDDVIDVNKYPLEQIKEMTLTTRKVGLGVMGFADMLIKMGVSYNSERALDVADDVMCRISYYARSASEELGKERGSFPAFGGSSFVPRFQHMRNATVTTIAPTGTLSIISGVSSGIEPLYAVAYKRRILGGEEFTEIHPLFYEFAKKHDVSDELLQRLPESWDSLPLPWEVKSLFVTAHQVPVRMHLKMQSAFQSYTDNAVSKTINMPHNATKSDVADAFLTAYKLRLKGITVYRDGSRGGQVLQAKGACGRNDMVVEVSPRPRPQVTMGHTHRVKTGCGNLYVTVNRDEHGLCEVFATIGKAGGCASCQVESVGRLISLGMRAGIGLSELHRQLSGIRCPSPAWNEGEMVLSCPDAISKVLAEYCGDLGEVQSDGVKCCPECGGGNLESEGGCIVCRDCGHSKCV